MIVPVLQPQRNQRRVGWLPKALLTLAGLGGLVALIVAVSSVAVYCSDESSRGCSDGSPSFGLIAQAILAVLGLPLLFAIGAALRRDRVQLALTVTGISIANYVAWGALLDIGAHGELTIV